MRCFVFSLQPALDKARFERDQREQSLAAALLEFERIHGDIHCNRRRTEELSERIRSSTAREAGRARQGVAAADLASCDRFLDHLRNQQKQLRRLLQQLEEQLDEARREASRRTEKLAVAAQRVEGLEDFEARERAAYARREDLAHEQAMDELAWMTGPCSKVPRPQATSTRQSR